MDDHLTQRWMHEDAAGPNRAPDYMSEPYEVMTTDGNVHVCYVDTKGLAEHLIELHNRTFGDGQDPPLQFKGQLYSEESPHPLDEALAKAHSLDEALTKAHADGTIFSDKGYESMDTASLNRILREGAAGPSTTPEPVGRTLREVPPVLSTSEEPPVNRRRPYLPDDLRVNQRRREDERLSYAYGAVVTVDVRNAVERLLAELVNRRVTDYLASHQPPLLRVPPESLPTDALIDVLEARGYQVAQKASPE